MTPVPFKISCLLFLTIVLLACSGSALEGDNNQPDPKVLVNAGINTLVNEQTTVILGGDAVGQTTALTFTWRVSPRIDIVHEDTSVASATFVTPATVVIMTYVFTLEVKDGDGNRGSDSVEYSVQPINELPDAVIEVSQLNGFATHSFPAGVEVILDGSASTDIDALDSNNPIAAYRWQQTAGQAVLQGISIDGDSLAFITPILDDNSTLEFSLTVSDHEGAQSLNQVSLSVQSATNTLPAVNAGLAHEVFSGESIVLNGRASSAVPAANPLSYSWLNDSESDPVIGNSNELQTYAVAPVVLSEQLVTFTLEVKDAFGNKVDDSITIKVRPQRLQPINDTGLVQQASDVAVFSRHVADYPGQDGQRGADIIYANGALEKSGRGEQGFDFTRLDSIGDEVDDTSLTWQCVRDNVTGLIWEAKTPMNDPGLNSTGHSYSWYQSNDNNDFTGEQSGASSTCSLASCNTSAYVDTINDQGLCNFRDWRLPDHNELLSILHLGKVNPPMIDPQYFPHTTSGLNPPVWYWTNNNSADGESSDTAQNAWAIDFASGNDNFLHKSSAARIRLVRAGR
ncbi:MAG: chitinase [Paraglaciecola sp.]|jgi:chitinase